jgi:nucleoside-diphosphate-sugar epimerase
MNEMNSTTIPKILVIGACGQIGTEMTSTLRHRYGQDNVIAGDLHEPDEKQRQAGPYYKLNVLDKASLHGLVIREKVNQVYHFAAMLSASGEKQPKPAWELNMQGLINVLDIAKTENTRVFWPSSIAVFGSRASKAACPQHEVLQPATVYGISKVAGELWCKYYHEQYGVDIRSIRYPGLIGAAAMPGGGTTDYAVDIFHHALGKRQYTCYLKPHTTLPMLYMPDAVRATMEIMGASLSSLNVKTAYNVAGLSFAPQDLEKAIQVHLPAFRVDYRPDFRQKIAESWPSSIDDHHARYDWGWKPQFDLEAMAADMLGQLVNAEQGQ